MRDYTHIEPKELNLFLLKLKEFINIENCEIEASFRIGNKTSATLILYDFDKDIIVKIGEIYAYYSDKQINNNVFFHFTPDRNYLDYYKNKKEISEFKVMSNLLRNSVFKELKINSRKKMAQFEDFMNNQDGNTHLVYEHHTANILNFKKVPFKIENILKYTFTTNYEIVPRLQFSIYGESEFPTHYYPEYLEALPQPLVFLLIYSNNKYTLSNNYECVTTGIVYEIEELENSKDIMNRFVFDLFYKQLLEVSKIDSLSYNQFKENEKYYKNLLEMILI